MLKDEFDLEEVDSGAIFWLEQAEEIINNC